jgi:hypothetical protein
MAERLENVQECIEALTAAMEHVSSVYIAAAPISGRVNMSPGASGALAGPWQKPSPSHLRHCGILYGP